jgi:hypothetical protein
MHDVFQVRLEEWGGVMARNYLNVPGMIPAAVITYAGLANNVYSSIEALNVDKKSK